MPQSTNPPPAPKRRLLPTTLRGKDVGVIITAAITAAAPFFAQQNNAKANDDVQAYQTYSAERQLEDINNRLYDISHQLRMLNAKIQFLEAKHRDEIDEGDITPPPPIIKDLTPENR